MAIDPARVQRLALEAEVLGRRPMDRDEARRILAVLAVVDAETVRPVLRDGATAVGEREPALSKAS